MNRRLPIVVTLGILSILTSGTFGQRNSDVVRLKAKQDGVGRGLAGKITQMTRHELVILRNGNREQSVPIVEIRSVAYSKEPTRLDRARTFVSQQQYADASEILETLDASKIERVEIRQDVEFYRALCEARIALRGRGSVTDAGSAMFKFTSAHKQSYHYLAACEVLGELLVRSGKYAQAMKYFQTLAEAPWPQTKIRAAVLMSRCLRQQKQWDQALSRLDGVLALAPQDEEDKLQFELAKLEKALCWVETDQADPAIDLIQKIIGDADPQQIELHARAYNALGYCHLKADQPQDAVLAYLHVELIYNSIPDVHYEALSQLVGLWRTLGKPQRSRETEMLLKERYSR